GGAAQIERARRLEEGGEQPADRRRGPERAGAAHPAPALPAAGRDGEEGDRPHQLAFRRGGGGPALTQDGRRASRRPRPPVTAPSSTAAPRAREIDLRDRVDVGEQRALRRVVAILDAGLALQHAPRLAALNAEEHELA